MRSGATTLRLDATLCLRFLDPAPRDDEEQVPEEQVALEELEDAPQELDDPAADLPDRSLAEHPAAAQRLGRLTH
ncbi:hypothetical protein [Gulosibacter chungangensis]|uniref:hypothetical protein n=1 Tax=Gulosibacter chungangensis TaxID=979746 RepID=UPI0017877E09|nr:hypothetical protein [Gulosibacter chungangensis]